jgi:hypothetical protein
MAIFPDYGVNHSSSVCGLYGIHMSQNVKTNNLKKTNDITYLSISIELLNYIHLCFRVKNKF